MVRGLNIDGDTCIAPLLSGNVTYSPVPLELSAHGTVLICCARPNTDMVLDMQRRAAGSRSAPDAREPGSALPTAAKRRQDN